MKRSQADPTTASNLEEWSAGKARHGRLRREDSSGVLREAAEIQKFDRAEDVLDYFDRSKARAIRPESKRNVRKPFAYPVKREAARRAVVGEKSARYRKKR